MKRLLPAGAIALCAVLFFAHTGTAQSTPAQQPAPASSPAVTIPQGQKFILQLETSIHTNSTRKGDRVEFRIAGDVVADNQTVIPAKSWARATVTKAKRAGRIMGRAEVQLQFDEIRLADGTILPLRASIIRVGVTALDAKDGQPRIKGEAGAGGNLGAVASTAAQGALIGVLTGGMKGAMYGGAAGAAIAAAGMLLRRGPDLDLPRDTMFEARFDQALSVPLAAAQHAVQAQRAEQMAQNNPPPETQVEAPPADDPALKTRPVLRRSERIEQPPAAGTETNPPSSGEIATAAPPVETQPPATPPPVSETNPQPPDVPQPPVAAAGRPAPVPAKSQPADPGGFKLSVNVRMVLVDAVVRDRAGRIIDNLAREDFRVYEDGVEQWIQSYSRDALPLAVALVVDHSGSVSPYIHELRRIANRALQQLKSGDKVALFSFANNVERVVDLTTDRQRIADGIARIGGGGSTDIGDALFDSISYLAKVAPDYRRAVILISDNQPTVRPQASEGDTIRMAMESETVVYSLKTSGEGISLGMRFPNILMGMGSVHKVIQETGGEVIDVASVGMLDAALTGVISRLRLRYAIAYYPSNQAPGGAFHTIEVRLGERLGKPGSDYFMHARRGYYSTPDQAASRINP